MVSSTDPRSRALAPEVDYFRRQFEQLATDVNAFVTGLSDAGSPGSRSRSGGRSHSASITSTQRHACICRCWTKGSPMPCGAAMQPGPYVYAG